MEPIGAQPVDHHVLGALEVRSGAVHLVDEADARDRVAVGLPPDRLGLGLDAGDGIEDDDTAIEDAKTSFDFRREVNVARRVDDVDLVAVPGGGGRSGSDGDAALALLLHPVHGGGALMDLTDLVGDPGVIEDALGHGGLTRVNVGNDSDVPDAFDVDLTWHGVWAVCPRGYQR